MFRILTYAGYSYYSGDVNRLIKYDKNGNTVKIFNPPTTGGRTEGVSVGGDRVAVVMEDRNIYILDLNLNVIATIPSGTYFSTHVVVDSNGNTYIQSYIQYSDTFEVRSVRKYNSSGSWVGVANLTNDFRVLQLLIAGDGGLLILTTYHQSRMLIAASDEYPVAISVLWINYRNKSICSR